MNNVNYKVREDLPLNNDFQSKFIEVDKQIWKYNRNVVIGVIYRPPFTSVSKFNEKIDELLAIISNENKWAIISGDFNINTYQGAQPFSEVNQEFQNLLLSNYFYPLINNPTRVDKVSATLIDNIYTNITMLAESHHSGIIHSSISDHYPIFTILTEKVINNAKKFIYRRQFSEKNKFKFKRDLGNVSWDVQNIDDASLAFEQFLDQFIHTYDSSFPEKKIKLNYKNRHTWIPNSLKKSINIKESLYIVSLVKPTTININNYVMYKNKLTSILRNLERSHYEQELDLNKNDLSKSWKIIKKVIGKESTKTKTNVAEFVINSKKVTDATVISNAFNNYFINVGKNLAANITSDIDPITYVSEYHQTFNIPEISQYEICTIVNNLLNTSPGWDGVSALIIQENLNTLITPLCDLVNKSFRQGIFPDYLKIAKVIPIFKNGECSNICNYRPISVLSTYSKIYEKVMYNYLIDFIDTNDILYKCQFGFRAKHSTQHAILTLVERVSRAMDNNKIVVGVFLDFKKAFDTVNHNILLHKLEKIGVRGTPLKWFKSYLQERQQFVLYDGNKSQTKTVTCGVPQGSILGPLLFIIYINDLASVSEKIFAILFADDTNIFLEGSNLADVISMLNTELMHVSKWLMANKLSLNLEKTHYMVFHRSKVKTNTCNYPLLIKNFELQELTSTKFLGVIIDNKLSWTSHIAYIKNKIAKGIGIICKARKYLNKHTLTKLYYSFIHPYLIYCVEAWGNALDTYLDPIIKLQKKIIRIISSASYLATTDPLFKNLNILPLKKLVVLRISIMMYKLNVGSTPEIIATFFTRNNEVHNYNTRQAKLLHADRGNNEHIYRTFTFRSVYIWNYILKKHIAINVSLLSFKLYMKNYLLYNDIQERYTK